MATYDVLIDNINNIDLQAGDVITCAYTGTYQAITLQPGTYKLECWGAQGGYYITSSTLHGGYGGYSTGTLTLSTPTQLFLYVGGSPGYRQAAGGFNGGGTGYRVGGGGATDIRISTSLYDRFIVAGGGGGWDTYHINLQNQHTAYGGAGGGQSGQSGYCSQHGSSSYYTGAGGTQTSGGAQALNITSSGAGYTSASFGQGGSCTSSTNSTMGVGGGGGWYGGGAGFGEGAGGGSGYVLTTANYSSNPSDELDETFCLTDAGTNTSTHTGAGEIKITVLNIGNNQSPEEEEEESNKFRSTMYLKISTDKWIVLNGSSSSNIENNIPSDDDNTFGEELQCCINNKIYTFREGMTWKDWVESSYNTDGFYINGDASIWQKGPLSIATFNYDELDCTMIKLTATNTIKSISELNVQCYYTQINLWDSGYDNFFLYDYENDNLYVCDMEYGDNFAGIVNWQNNSLINMSNDVRIEFQAVPNSTNVYVYRTDDNIYENNDVDQSILYDPPSTPALLTYKPSLGSVYIFNY